MIDLRVAVATCAVLLASLALPGSGDRAVAGSHVRMVNPGAGVKPQLEADRFRQELLRREMERKMRALTFLRPCGPGIRNGRFVRSVETRGLRPGLTPRQARARLPVAGRSEGARVSTLRCRDGRGRMVMVVTADGLRDDSIRALQWRLRFVRDRGTSTWRLRDYGVRWRCYRGGDPRRRWTTRPCL